jgi:hypothetical protein
MSWILRKLDSMGGAVFAGVAGAAASQGQAFTLAYLQRLGGRLDEARHVMEQARSGVLLPDAAPALRDDLVADLTARVADLESRMAALQMVDPLWRPFVLAVKADSAVAAATLEQFAPALPLTLATAVHAGVGLVIGLLVWEVCKTPALPVRYWRRRVKARAAARVRKARRRGTARAEPVLTRGVETAGDAPPRGPRP